MDPPERIPLTDAQYQELRLYIDGNPRREAQRPNRNLIRRNLITLAPTHGHGHYRITEFGKLALADRRWAGDGIDMPEALALEMIDTLGFLPEEALAMAEHAARESYVWANVQRQHEQPEVCAAISAYFARREVAWRKLAGLLELLALELIEEEEADDDDSEADD